MLEQVLDRMPVLISGEYGGSAEQEFELRYRREIVRRLDEMEIFGVPSYVVGRRYPLSIAYVSLSVDSLGRAQIGDEKLPSDPSTVKQGKRPNDGGSTIAVERALSAFSSVLIKGEAGSGKTTLLRWLAVRSAQRSLPADLEDWNDLIPIFIPLRRYAKQQLPAPEEFLDYIGSHILEYKPDGWVTRLLDGGGAIILIDGIDELPDSRRTQIRGWLESLTETYTECRWIVTSRPPAAQRTWLPRDQFAGMTLQPMGVVQTRSFVQHWYSAMKAGATVEEQDRLEASQSSLMVTVETTPALRSLASNPLLCALMCALHLAREGQLPRERMELYRVALEMLLSRRDEERGVLDEVGQSLSHADKLHLLERLAAWFIINELVDSSQSLALQVISQNLRVMPTIRAEPEEVFKYLLVRSGVLRAPAEGRIDFVHKTFQEYLGAKSLVEQLNIELLAKSAHKEEFHEVIVMAVGHARRSEREELLDRILARLDDKRLPRQSAERLRFVVVSCMETCREISPDMYQRMNAILKSLVPLKSISQATRIARLGEPVLPLLKASPPVTAHEIAATIRALSLIGGREAIELIAGFAIDSSVVIDELVRAWSYFPADEFADRVLALRQFRGRLIKVSDLAVVGSLPRLSNLEAVDLDLPGEEIDSLWRLEDVPRLNSLRIVGGDRLKSLDGIQRHPTLKQVSLVSCSGISDFASLAQLPVLEDLIIKNGQHPVTLDTASIPSLRNLTITTPAPAAIEGIASGRNLHFLHIINCPATSLSSFGGSDTIEELKLDHFYDLRSLEGLQQVTSLKAATIIRCPRLTSLLPLAQHQRIDMIRVSSSPNIDFATLKDSRCRELDIRHSEIPDLEWIKRLVFLRRLRLIGCKVGDLRCINSLTLELLDLRNTSQFAGGGVDMVGVSLDTRCEVIISPAQVVKNLSPQIRVHLR
jgi:hypothetical protein